MIIYKATNKINGKAYVGQTVKNLKRRRQEHINVALKKDDNSYFHRAIRKYGFGVFGWEILVEGAGSPEILNGLEKHFIRLYNTFEKGYNLTLGGGGGAGRIPSEETRQKISDANKGKRLSEGQKKKISETLKGKYVAENNPMFGKYHTEETKRKMSKIKDGRFIGKDSPHATAVIIGNKYFDTRNQAAKFLGVTSALIRSRILHKTKWLDYKYAHKGEN